MDQDYCLEMDPDGIIQYTILSDQHLSLQKRKQIIYMMIADILKQVEEYYFIFSLKWSVAKTRNVT